MSYTIELKFTRRDHVPINIHACGDDIKDLLSDAEYSIDCPDPKHFHPIGDLSQSEFDDVMEAMSDEIVAQDEMRKESIDNR